MQRLTAQSYLKVRMKMQRKVFLFVLCGVLALTGQAMAETLEEILAKNLEVRGGEDAILAVQTTRSTGTMRMGGSAAGALEVPFIAEFKRPNKVRIEFTMQGMTAVQAYDGEVGWAVMPFLGKTEPEEMAEDQLKDIKEQADFDGPLVNYKEKGHTVELVGTEEVDGTPAYKLKVTKANGDTVNLYLDQEYYIEFKADTKREVQGAEVEVSTVFGDYKEVEGLLFAHSMEISFAGNPAGQVITIDNMELDVEIDDDRFAMPEPKETEEKAGE
jgi:outer membrane lipoprotein-sorting protein